MKRSRSRGDGMNRKGSDGLRYLRTYPRLMKWMNTCAGCGTMGHKPELPREITGPGEQWTVCAQNIRRYFDVLVVNEVSLCSMCAG